MFWGELLCEFWLGKPGEVLSHLRGFPHHSSVNFCEVEIKQCLSVLSAMPDSRMVLKNVSFFVLS